jgi:outer membrane receptor protein involved in Fe transport
MDRASWAEHGRSVGQGRYLSSRATLSGSQVQAATVIDVSMIQPLGRDWELFGFVGNLFDDQYADPASAQHLQDVNVQNGRTARIGLRWTPWRP